MPHTPIIPQPRLKTLLTILSDLQNDHSDLLHRISADLYEAASRLQFQAQEYEDPGCRSRKEAWGLSSCNQDDDVSSTMDEEENLTDLELKLNLEMKSSARAIEDGKMLRDLLARIVDDGSRREIGIEKGRTRLDAESPVYDKLASLKKNSELSPLQIVYELAASKMAQAHMHAIAQDNMPAKAMKRKRTSLTEMEYDPSDHLGAFIREQGLACSSQVSDPGGQASTANGGHVSETSFDSDEGLCDSIASLTEDDGSGEGVEEAGPDTPSSTSTLFGLGLGKDDASDVDLGDVVSHKNTAERAVDQQMAEIRRMDVLRAAERCGEIYQENVMGENLVKWARAE